MDLSMIMFRRMERGRERTMVRNLWALAFLLDSV